LIEDRMIPAPVLRYEAQDSFALQSEAERAAVVQRWCATHLDPLLAKLPAARLHAFGEDFGRNGDLTVIAPVTLEQNLHRSFPFVVELRNVPFRQQEQILHHLVARLPRFLAGAMDATGNGQALAEYTADRFGPQRILQVRFNDAWYLENMPRFKAAFEDGTISLPRDSEILGDLRLLQTINGVPKLPKTRTKGAGGKQRHGDAAVALALAYSATRAEVEEFAYQPVRLRPSGREDDEDDDRPARPVRATGGFRGIGGAL